MYNRRRLSCAWIRDVARPVPRETKIILVATIVRRLPQWVLQSAERCFASLSNTSPMSAIFSGASLLTLRRATPLRVNLLERCSSSTAKLPQLEEAMDVSL
ncbi:hypothetical protein K443DRAFT_16146 [Laccaria amethystina LaAM-08-1]|uniref:Uncharacterized protein n=1 Tax=Laccaria amethystina LaAM-08-1 TaxID=1095629 RepID=A0A0C9WKG7_9AGAR|nr:hypothetical protein K443DRAFT_16146 [Laccaria amethystina LaAM-08-1]